LNYLADVNFHVAWGWSDHVEHARVASWIARAFLRNSLVLVSRAKSRAVEGIAEILKAEIGSARCIAGLHPCVSVSQRFRLVQ
jgi:hypothetical protein